ncbi:hypothetical protein B0H11DRAFT_2245901 [Mycena galericulata]|nr:hypothetical protein B0H11DRAFT_2245901 [Mycena galericulata]
MLSTRSLRSSQRSLQSTGVAASSACAAFWSSADVTQYTLSYLNFEELIIIARTSRTTAFFVRILVRGRVMRYVSPFLPDGAVTSFFNSLKSARAWIVGSVPLAVVSVLGDAPLRKNMNIVVPHDEYRELFFFFVFQHGFNRTTSEQTSGAYAADGCMFMCFEHPSLPGLSITVTTSGASNVWRLFLAAPNTIQQVAISANTILLPYPRMVAEHEGVKGFRAVQLAIAGTPIIPENQTYHTKSPFPGLVRLHEDTSAWSRACGEACPAVIRTTYGLRGIGRWQWGGGGRRRDGRRTDAGSGFTGPHHVSFGRCLPQQDL